MRAAYVASALREPISTDRLLDTLDRMYRERGKLAVVGSLDS